MKTTNWQRIEAVQQYTRLNTNAFARSISLKRSENLYQIKKGNNGISKELANLITDKYPEIDKLWLLTGEGNMFVSSSAQEQENSPLKTVPTTRIPFYERDMYTVAKNYSMISVSSYFEMPAISSCDFAINMCGSAMAPVIESGCTVFVKAIDKSIILYGEIYLILTRSYAAIRYIDFDGNDEDRLTLIPANNQHRTNSVSRDEIEAVFAIVGSFKQFV